jgi:hypothetical protein
METTTHPFTRPLVGDRVRVLFPGSVGYDTETVEGVVTAVDADSFDVRSGEAIGESFTLYDVEQTVAVVEVLS